MGPKDHLTGASKVSKSCSRSLKLRLLYAELIQFGQADHLHKCLSESFVQEFCDRAEKGLLTVWCFPLPCWQCSICTASARSDCPWTCRCWPNVRSALWTRNVEPSLSLTHCTLFATFASTLIWKGLSLDQRPNALAPVDDKCLYRAIVLWHLDNLLGLEFLAGVDVEQYRWRQRTGWRDSLCRSPEISLCKP